MQHFLNLETPEPSEGLNRFYEDLKGKFDPIQYYFAESCYYLLIRSLKHACRSIKTGYFPPKSDL